MLPESLCAELIAPCGMNCGLCIACLREKNRCDGCNGDDTRKPQHCAPCRIKNCEELAANGGGFCFTCAKFPCVRLRQLDARYRTRYRMSMVENLLHVRDLGLDSFVVSERERWKCLECGGLVCVHGARCTSCGRVNV